MDFLTAGPSVSKLAASCAAAKMSAGSRWSWPPCSRYGDSGTKSPGPKYSRGGASPGVSCLSCGRAGAGDLWIEFLNFDVYEVYDT